jgi:hypothetical protein
MRSEKFKVFVPLSYRASSWCTIMAQPIDGLPVMSGVGGKTRTAATDKGTTLYNRLLTFSILFWHLSCLFLETGGLHGDPYKHRNASWEKNQQR